MREFLLGHTLTNRPGAGSLLASATETNIGAVPGPYVEISGTTTITSFGIAPRGVVRILRFTDALILTHNATSLILNAAAGNITTAANDTAIAVSLGAGNWKVDVTLAAGTSPVAPSSGLKFIASQTAASSASLTFTTTIDSTYHAYLFTYDLTVGTDNVYTWIRTATAGSAFATSTGAYSWGVQTRGAFSSSASDDAMEMWDAAAGSATSAGVGSAAGEHTWGTIIFYNPTSTSLYKSVEWHNGWTNADGIPITAQGAGIVLNASTAMTGLQLIPSSGNFVAGTMRQYGIANS